MGEGSVKLMLGGGICGGGGGASQTDIEAQMDGGSGGGVGGERPGTLKICWAPSSMRGHTW